VRDREAPFGAYLKSFYGRRALRIFPLYYLALAVLALVAIWDRDPELRQGLPFAATYTYNFWYATKATAPCLLISHFWSLCVEEQFYLVWPLVIYFVPRRFLGSLLLAIVFVAPLLRFALSRWLAGPGVTRLWDVDVALDVLTPTHLDAFAIGALFSLSSKRKSSLGALLAVLSVLGAVGLFLKHRAQLPLLSFGFPIGLKAGYAFIWGYSLISLAAGLCIDCLVQRRFFPQLFESRVLTYLGKISYGLYVIHYPVQGLIAQLAPHASVTLRLSAQLFLTVVLASASYYFWEKRFLSRKDALFPAAGETNPAIAFVGP
jgi:peptidoglycan/LPS O-acetylase OafA/YrhL